MVGKKKTTADVLERDILDSIPNLRDPNGPGKPIHDAAALFHRLQEDKKKVFDELQLTQGDDSPFIRFDHVADAQALLRGESLDSLTVPRVEGCRAAILRKLYALEGAIPSAQERIREVEIAVSREQLSEVRESAQALASRTIEAVEKLLDCVRAERDFFSAMRKAGFRLDLVGGHWSLWGQMESWICGDTHWPSLERFCKDRREAWGIDSETPKTGGRQ